MTQSERDARGYIADAFRCLEEVGDLKSNDLLNYILNFNVRAQLGELFISLICDEIRTHRWGSKFIANYVQEHPDISDIALLQWICKYGGYYIVKGVLYRAGNVWK